MREGAKLLRNIRIFLGEGEDMIVDEVLCKVVLHLNSTGETDVGPYANEYMAVLTITEDGQLINHVTEFINSSYTLNLVSKLMSQATQTLRPPRESWALRCKGEIKEYMPSYRISICKWKN